MPVHYKKKKKDELKIASSFDIDPTGHKKAQKGKKIYDKGKSTTNPNEKDKGLNF